MLNEATEARLCLAVHSLRMFARMNFIFFPLVSFATMTWLII